MRGALRWACKLISRHSLWKKRPISLWHFHVKEFSIRRMRVNSLWDMGTVVNKEKMGLPDVVFKLDQLDFHPSQTLKWPLARHIVAISGISCMIHFARIAGKKSTEFRIPADNKSLNINQHTQNVKKNSISHNSNWSTHKQEGAPQNI